MEKDSKIYVAGHRGMVGSAIVRELRRQGYMNIITRTHRELDLCRQDEVERFFVEEKPEYVFLAAAKVGGIVANSEALADFMYDNMMLEMNVINSAWRNGCRKLEFLGSSCIYPRMAPQPMKEECLLTSELEKTNEAYALAKISGLKYCEFLNRQYGTDFISYQSLRHQRQLPSHTFACGPGPDTPFPRGQGAGFGTGYLLGRRKPVA